MQSIKIVGQICTGGPDFLKELDILLLFLSINVVFNKATPLIWPLQYHLKIEIMLQGLSSPLG